MSNHIHLLATPEEEVSCGKMMHAVAQRFAYYFNHDEPRTGTLWEGRYRSCIVESSGYVVACYRYIELNPVRAGLVRHPWEYRWSSCLGNSGNRTDPLITPQADYGALSSEAYLTLLSDGIDTATLKAIRDSTNAGYPLASNAFKTSLAANTGRRVEPGKAGRPVADGPKESVNVPDLFSAGGVS